MRGRIPGFFITFEGIEGSGKTHQIRLLSSYLRAKGLRVVDVREPGSTRIGEHIRKILLDRRYHEMAVSCELLLYVAARCQLIEEKITPLLTQGAVVLCDRFSDATFAYQGFGGGIDVKRINLLHKGVIRALWPDLTILLDVSVSKGLARAGQKKDRIEARSYRFHCRVRRGYHTLARAYPGRIKVVSTLASIPEVQSKIRGIVEQALRRKGLWDV